jgi:dienelactone hydrolase
MVAGMTALVVTATACVPAAPPSPAPYLDPVYSDLRTTPQATPLSYGAAPPIDPTVGPNDPHRRPLDGAGNEIQRMWITDPVDNTAERRPAIIFIHGGGFKGGIGQAYPLLTSARAYAQRGYVLFSIEYRTDTTSECQAVQDHTGDPDDPGHLARKAQCERGITAAQRDAQAAVRWVRRHAAQYRVDPNMIAAGGFSAGAITAANLAYNSDLAGTYAYSSEDDPRTGSRVQAAFGSSGCNYDPTTIGAGDAPVSFIHGELDALVDYDTCVVPSFRTARQAGLVAELASYCGDRRHAQRLYVAYQLATDEAWTTFLARELKIYRDMRPPSAAAFCP